MSAVVGIVYHGRGGTPPLTSDRGLTVMTHVNADAARATPWRGFGANHNDLMSRARGADWYVALNPDVHASAGDIRRLLDFCAAEDFDIAAPLLRSPWGMVGNGRRPFPSPSLWLTEAVFGAMRLERHSVGSPARDFAVGWVSGACMAIRLQDPGLRFDERYFMYFEDADLCFRARQEGKRVGVCPSVIVDHESGWSAGDALRWRRGVEFARSAMRFAGVSGHSPKAMRIAGAVRWGSRVVLRGATKSADAGSRAVARGFLNPRAPGLVELALSYRPTAKD